MWDGVTIVLGQRSLRRFPIRVRSPRQGSSSTAPGSTTRVGRSATSAPVGRDGLQVPGAPFNMIGNDGAAYPVQTLVEQLEPQWRRLLFGRVVSPGWASSPLRKGSYKALKRRHTAQVGVQNLGTQRKLALATLLVIPSIDLPS